MTKARRTQTKKCWSWAACARHLLWIAVHGDALGGKVRPAEKREYGHATVERVAESRLFEGVPKVLSVWMSHGDSAEELPPGFCLTAKDRKCRSCVENAGQKMWAVQFHPEVHSHAARSDILRNFALKICGAPPTWTGQHFIESHGSFRQAQVGKGHAICALSGGVDSSVAAVLVDRGVARFVRQVEADMRLRQQRVLRKNGIRESPAEPARQSGTAPGRGRCH